jgi:hypothetical protein
MNSLLEQIAQIENQERAELMARYRDLLAKSETLDDTGARQLFVTARGLGKNSTDIWEDKRNMLEYERELVIAGEQEKWCAEDQRLSALVRESKKRTDTEIGRLHALHNTLVNENEAVGRKHVRANAGFYRAADLALKHWEILGIPNPALTAPEPISELLKRSGINAVIPEGAKLISTADVLTPNTLPVRVEKTAPSDLGGGAVAGEKSPMGFVPKGGGSPAGGDQRESAVKGLAELL